MHLLAQEGGPIQAVFGSFENNMLLFILAISVVALIVAYFLRRGVLAAPEGSPKMIEIATAIQEGSKAYLNRQFRTVGAFLAMLTVVLYFVLPVHESATHSEVVLRL